MPIVEEVICATMPEAVAELGHEATVEKTPETVARTVFRISTEPNLESSQASHGTDSDITPGIVPELVKRFSKNYGVVISSEHEELSQSSASHHAANNDSSVPNKISTALATAASPTRTQRGTPQVSIVAQEKRDVYVQSVKEEEEEVQKVSGIMIQDQEDGNISWATVVDETLDNDGLHEYDSDNFSISEAECAIITNADKDQEELQRCGSKLMNVLNDVKRQELKIKKELKEKKRLEMELKLKTDELKVNEAKLMELKEKRNKRAEKLRETVEGLTKKLA